MWAAYQMGAFDAIFRRAEETSGQKLSGLKEAELAETLDLMSAGQEATMIEALSARPGATRGQPIPAGFVLAVRQGRTLWPHVLWFPWATARNRLEGALRWLLAARDEATVMIAAPIDSKRFWEQLARYGVLRRVGTVHDFYCAGDRVQLWQSRGA